MNAQNNLVRNNLKWLFELPVFLRTWLVVQCTKNINLKEEMSPESEKQQNSYLGMGHSVIIFILRAITIVLT